MWSLLVLTAVLTTSEGVPPTLIVDPPPPATGSSCPIACPDIYQPVCADCKSGGKTTFSNGCDLARQNRCNPSRRCTKISDGECPKPKPSSTVRPNPGGPECPAACPALYQPVCAKCPKGKQTFSNDCILRQNYCQTGEVCNKISNGACPKDPPNIRCSNLCTLEYNPICAQCHDGRKTFNNACSLRRHNCDLSVECTKISDGECPNQPKPPTTESPNPGDPRCPEACLKEYQPVCGQCPKGRRTFTNDCRFHQNYCETGEECFKISDGECPKESPSTGCSTICTLEYSPICAQCRGGKQTFGNACFMRQYICEKKEECTKIRDGRCPETSSPKPNPGGPECPDACTFVYQPICAQCPSGRKTFSNDCSFRQHYCQSGEECAKITDGECRTQPQSTGCPSVCSKEYIPVCAQCRDAKQTFNNLCSLRKFNCESRGGCTYLQDGACTPAAPASDCPRECPATRNVVYALCPRNRYFSFTNICHLNSFNCRTKQNCRLITRAISYIACKPGQCPKTITTTKAVPLAAQISADPEEHDHVLEKRSADNPIPSEEHAGKSLTGEQPSEQPDEEKLAHYEVNEEPNEPPVEAKPYLTKPKPKTEEKADQPIDKEQPEVPQTGEQTDLTQVRERTDDPSLEADQPEPPKNPDTSVCAATLCSNEVKRVCARCGNTFSSFVNDCLLYIHNCFNNNECTKLYDGECTQQTTSLCTTEHAPVCASCSNNRPQTFANECYLKANQILNPKDKCTKVSNGACDTECPLLNCAAIKDPLCAICGSELQTFENGCIFSSYNCPNGFICSKILNGSCPSPPCTADWKPICASCPDGSQTFPNECLLNARNSKYPNKCTKQHDGECTKEPTPLCTTGHAQVCASCLNSRPKTFANECYLNVNQILNPKEKCTKYSDGPCDTECPQIKCATVEEPVCAICGPELRTFRNGCYLSSYNCPSGFTCTKVLNSTCPASCTAGWKPVCATCSDGPQTFPNKCLLNARNSGNPFECTKLYDGECSQQTTSMCTTEHAPVCASCSNNRSQTFANECYLKANQILNPKDKCTKVSNGACDTGCPLVFCPAIKEPLCAICGSELRTFENGCIFSSYNCRNGFICTEILNGSCPSPPCTADWKPICASCPDGSQTFPNECLLNARNLKYPNKCTKQHDGECTKEPTSLCTTGHAQVCASCTNSRPKTFANECYLHVNQILNPKEKCTKYSDGPCDAQCPQIRCATFEEPVCAICGPELRTFRNGCYLSSYNCPSGFTCTQVLNSTCPASCTAGWKPVCATCSDGPQTFPNKCLLNARNSGNPFAKCNLIHQGACRHSEGSQHCTSEIKPVCARCGNFKFIFTNQCFLERHTYQSGQRCVKLHNGPC